MSKRKGSAFLQPNTPAAFVTNTTATVGEEDVAAQSRLDTVQLDGSVLGWRAALKAEFGEDAVPGMGGGGGMGYGGEPEEVAVIDAAPTTEYRMVMNHLLSGHSTFVWEDKDAVQDVLQPAFRGLGKPKGVDAKLVAVHDLPSADKAAFEALIVLWRKRAQESAQRRREVEAAEGAAAGGADADLEFEEDVQPAPAATRGPRSEAAVQGGSAATGVAEVATTSAGAATDAAAPPAPAVNSFLLRAQRALEKVANS